MKFTLKNYQEDAVRDVLVNLRKARKRWHEDQEKNAFSLTATTGAGKTVMAAAVFEALFHGDDDFDFVSDQGAVVIWFSDDPSLNVQSMHRLTEASDRLLVSDLVEVKKTFSRDKFEAGKVYFLNTQKLGKKSLLVRGHDPDDEGVVTDERQGTILPDLRGFTIWDTIQNTIEDPNLTLYLVVDEAHRGMKEPNAATQETRQTIVRKLINGHGAIPGIPVVLGISATVERFNAAVNQMEGRTILSSVVVDSAKVQESGLLKDTIILDVPDEDGQFETVLVRRGVDKLKEISEAWKDYAKEQGLQKAVQPLMVLQVPNKPDKDQIGTALDTIFERLPELSTDAIAHVFGEHTTQTFGAYTVPYVSPERVQESDWIRILIAKDAISTGWDCPRAEVMVSFRAATDRTHITQLLGRMVRSPLARRIPGNERLNSVECLLPFFNRQSVENVANALMTGTDSGETLEGRRVLVGAKEMTPNPAMPAAVWDKLTSLPSYSIPKKQSHPIKRLTILAHELAADGLLPGAGKAAHAKLHEALDTACMRYKGEIDAARNDVLTVEGATLQADLAAGDMSFNEFVEVADYTVIEDAYKRAGRLISPALAKSYAEHLAGRHDDPDDLEEALMDAHTSVAALGLVSAVKDYIEAEADKIAKAWLHEYREQITGLTDERQDTYREIREMSSEPIDVDLVQPKMWMQPTAAIEANGTEVPLPTFERHLLCDSEGNFPEELNEWERAVLQIEQQHDDFTGWYRNPARASQDSLGVIYNDEIDNKVLRPDFIFFSEVAGGEIVVDLVDPHGTHLADALPKLRGLADYAVTNGSIYRRIDAVAQIDGTYMVLDMQNPDVRAAIAASTSAEKLYRSESASTYQVAAG